METQQLEDGFEVNPLPNGKHRVGYIYTTGTYEVKLSKDSNVIGGVYLTKYQYGNEAGACYNRRTDIKWQSDDDGAYLDDRELNRIVKGIQFLRCSE